MAEPQGYELTVLVVERRRVPLWHPPALLLTTLASLAAAPIGVQSTALPVVRPARPAHTWIQTRPIFAVDIQPGAQYVWPNPAPRKAAPLPSQVGSRAILEVVAPPPDPLRPVLWTVPARAPRQTPTWVQFYVLEGIPFIQADWPNPVIRPARARVADTVRNLGLATAAVPDPVRPLAWPNPGQKFKPPQIPEMGRSRALLDTVLGDPLRPFDWPLPRTKGRPLGTWTQNRPSFYEEPAAPASPLVPCDWPVPRRTTLQTYTWLQTRPIFAQDVKPFGQTEWPLPSRRPARLPESWTPPVSAALEPAPALPFPTDYDLIVTVRPTLRTITIGVNEGALILQNPTDAVVYVVDWSRYLPDTALIASSTFTVTAIRGTAPTLDQALVLPGVQSARVRITAPNTTSAFCRVDHRIVTNEIIPRTIERKFFVQVERIIEVLAVKDPSDVAMVAIDWAAHLGTAMLAGFPVTTITSVRPSGDTALLVDSEALLTDEDGITVQSARMRLSVGTLGALYRIDHQIVTDDSPSQTITRSFLLLLEQR